MKFVRFNLGDNGRNVGVIDIVRSQITAVSSRNDERGCHIHMKGDIAIEIYDEHRQVFAVLVGDGGDLL